jgi:opacity protein-like surface antigen
VRKFFLVLLMGGLLLISSVVSTQAASVYVDTMVGGTVDDPNGYGDGDAHDTYIGFELPVDKFKFNVELLTGDWDQDYNPDDDFSGYDIKGGYQIVNNPDLKLYATLSRYQRDFDDSDQKFSGTLIGMDAICNLSKKTNIEGDIGVSLTGKFEQYGFHQDADLLNFKVKLNYLLTKDVIASLGYRYYQFKMDDLDQEVKAEGLTMGVGFKF